MRRATPLRPEQLKVAIIGAGATGVELAAELHRTTREMVAYGLDRVDADKDIRVSVIEAAPRVLPALPERLSQATESLLTKLGVEVHTHAKVAEVLPGGVRLADGRLLPAELVVWAAGVKAPDFLKDIAGLETNRTNQLVVKPTLQTSRDDDVFAIGDCAACAWPQADHGKGGMVPPRAQAAHQQASHMVQQIKSAPGRPAAAAVPLPRLRLAGLAGRVQHGGQHDGRAHRRQPDGRGPVRAHDVPVALQDARAGAAWPSPRSRSTRWRA
jgi:NADH dehydrogenase